MGFFFFWNGGKEWDWNRIDGVYEVQKRKRIEVTRLSSMALIPCRKA